MSEVNQNEIDQTAFDELLDAIRANERTPPDRGSINWDGKERSYEIIIDFQQNGQTEPPEIVRSRALAFLEGLTPEQRRAQLNIRYRNGVPVSALFRGTTKELDPKRLNQMKDRLGL